MEGGTAGAAGEGGEAETEDGFKVLRDKEAFPGWNAHCMPLASLENLAECKAQCRARGFGGFVACGGLAFFRRQSAEKCLQSLVDQPGVTTFLDLRPDAGRAAQATRVLFLPAPMRGHAGPLMRVAAWFAREEGYEAHVWLGQCWQELAPKGAILHDDFGMERLDEWAAAFGSVFGSLTEESDWYGSMAKMATAMLSDEAKCQMASDVNVGAARMVRKVTPDLVIADSMFTTGGAIPGLCARHSGAPFVELVCPGRPGASGWAWLWLLVTQGKELSKVAAAGEAGERRLLEETGPKLPEPHLWPQLLPSCEALVGEAPAAREVFVGPLVPLPRPMGTSKGLQQPGFAASTRIDAELREWMTGRTPADEHVARPDLPIVYVAFGTMVQPTEGFLARFTEGLESEEWRVLWSMPKAQQVRLPARLQGEQAKSARWRVEAFVPQAEVLGFAGVRAFVSHCGQNSTQESLSLGVPMICVPFYCDQFEWAETVCGQHRAGVQLDKLTATPERVRATVAAVLGRERYRAAALACAERMRGESPGAAGPPETASEEGPGVAEAARVALEALHWDWKPRPPAALSSRIGTGLTRFGTQLGNMFEDVKAGIF